MSRSSTVIHTSRSSAVLSHEASMSASVCGATISPDFVARGSADGRGQHRDHTDLDAGNVIRVDRTVCRGFRTRSLLMIAVLTLGREHRSVAQI
jgi:hypothetical protein